jgi:DNA-binding NtrC family response regulator
LFGHEKGAFTGAETRRSGAFERANGGTIFLDEIGELPASIQPVLLGVLERRKFRRLGGDTDVQVDLRVVSATHRDLRAEVNSNGFRPDLYFRLAVARLELPPLRERLEDLPALVEHFVREITGSSEPNPFSPATIEALMRHHWSGNVRELRNVVESALLIGEVSIDNTDPTATAAAKKVEPFTLEPYREARARAVGEFERRYAERLLKECGGNVSEAARRGQMDRGYLLSLLKRHQLR